MTFTANFNKGMMDTTCSRPRDTVVPIISDEPGIQVGVATFTLLRICPCMFPLNMLQQITVIVICCPLVCITYTLHKVLETELISNTRCKEQNPTQFSPLESVN
jgi:hypothetical protein